MKKLTQWLTDIFDPAHELDTFSVGEALNDPYTRGRWLADVLDEVKRMNIEVDKKLINGHDYGFTELCARRKAFKDILEMILAARRAVNNEPKRPNPKVPDAINLDRVTA